MEQGNYWLLLTVFVLGLALIWTMMSIIPFGGWLTARITGVNIGLGKLTRMKFRKVPVDKIITSLITCHKVDIDIDITDLEKHSLAGGDVSKVVIALVKAK